MQYQAAMPCHTACDGHFCFTVHSRAVYLLNVGTKTLRRQDCAVLDSCLLYRHCVLLCYPWSCLYTLLAALKGR